MEALAAGMSWRRFMALLSGLSASSRWQLALASEKDAPRVLEGAAIDRYMRSIGTAKG